jgi:hypothetical protein
MTRKKEGSFNFMLFKDASNMLGTIGEFMAREDQCYLFMGAITSYNSSMVIGERSCIAGFAAIKEN